MIKKGSIVYHKQVIFEDGEIDIKKHRPGVVLFSIEYEGKTYICTCPFTSQVKAFNKRPKKYKFIPEQIYQYRKLSFAKLNSVRLYPEEETYETRYSLSDLSVDSIVNAVLDMEVNDTQKNLIYIKKILEYEKLFMKLEENEQKREKKLLKREKRQKAKSVI